MPIAPISVIPQGTYPIGTRNFGPAALPQGASRIVLALDGAAMTDPALQVTVSLDFSLDGGATWASDDPGPATNPYPISMTLNGGQLTRQQPPQPLPAYTMGAPLPDTANLNRKIKGTIVISGTPLTTAGTITLT